MSETTESMGAYYGELDLLDPDNIQAELVREAERKGPVWVSKKGMIWLISKMSDVHLSNTVRMLERNADGLRKRALGAIVTEQEIRYSLHGACIIWTGPDLAERAKMFSKMSGPEYLETREDYQALISELDTRNIDLG